MKGQRFVQKWILLVIGAAFLSSILNGLVLPPSDQRKTAASSATPASNYHCFTARLQGYWDFQSNSMRFKDQYCDSQLETLVQEPSMPNPAATGMGVNDHTKVTLVDRLQGSCILLFGDSTDRQITESWCPRWMEDRIRRKDKAIQLWSPKNRTTGRSIRDHVLAGKVWKNGGIRCSPGNKFTFGSFMHYGVSPAPLWKFAHTYETDLPHAELSWGNTTDERLEQDIPRYFAECDAQGHNRLRVVVVQSYLWDLARQWFVYDTERPPPSMIQEWAVNATRLVQRVRKAVPAGTLIAWRFAGPVAADKGRDPEAIAEMNAAFLEQQKVQQPGDTVDFVVDYGAILGSELAQKSGPFPAHPPDLPRTAYLNLLLNAVLTTIPPSAEPEGT